MKSKIKKSKKSISNSKKRISNSKKSISNSKNVNSELSKEMLKNKYPDFKPNLTPKQIFQLGSFGGTYWRPIHSKVTGQDYSNIHTKKYPKDWWTGLNNNQLTNSWDKYDKGINNYGEKVGQTLEDWENSGWINKNHPYGWVHWYCDFYIGKTCPDDERQIKRWINTAGPRSRWRRRLINLINKNNATYDDYSISPKIRQVLQHWGYRLTESDMKK